MWVSRVLDGVVEGAYQSLSRGPRLMKGTAHRDVVHLHRPSLHSMGLPGKERMLMLCHGSTD